MRKFFCAAAFSLISASAFAITPADLATNSWMPPEAEHTAGCELPSLIEFHKDGSVFGEPGCNTLTGSYKLDEDGRIDLSGVGMTAKICAKEYMDQEDKFMAMLRQTHFIKKVEKDLILMDQDKKEVGRLVPEKSKACN